jgi:hypothetical protein
MGHIFPIYKEGVFVTAGLESQGELTGAVIFASGWALLLGYLVFNSSA